MKYNFSRSSWLWIALIGIPFVLAFSWNAAKINVFMAGDSTMSIKNVNAYPETGWGMPFVNFFDSTVKVHNYARNGSSTKSFLNDKLWTPIIDSLKPGDYVFIEFGHNDEVQGKSTATTATEFKDNLRRFVSETRSKEGIAVLLTPTARRKFDVSGKVVETHEIYANIVRQLAAELNVPLIDLDRESKMLIQKYGPEDSKNLFNYLNPGENPNYPDGSTDDTHFSELGARKIASITLSAIRSLQLELSNRIVKPPVTQKSTPLPYEKH